MSTPINIKSGVIYMLWMSDDINLMYVFLNYIMFNIKVNSNRGY